MNAGRTSPWLLVSALGLEAGAGLYKERALVPRWSASPPASLIACNLQAMRPTPRPSFWIVLTPLMGLLGLANVAAAWRSRKPVRGWRLGDAAEMGVVVAVMPLYFVATLRRFESRRQGGSEEMAAQVQRWVALNWGRAAVCLGGFLCLLMAFSIGARTA